jgi:hypothetical protein
MEISGLYPLTPEQISALEAGGGIMHGQDPLTRRKYLLIEQIEPTISDEYVRDKLREGLSDIDAGKVTDWNAEDFKSQLLRRHMSR